MSSKVNPVLGGHRDLIADEVFTIVNDPGGVEQSQNTFLYMGRKSGRFRQLGSAVSQIAPNDRLRRRFRVPEKVSEIGIDLRRAKDSSHLIEY